MRSLLDSELDEKLNRFREAQRDLYQYLGIARNEGDGSQEYLRAKRYAHSGGLADIPSPYPEVLDYRARVWRIAEIRDMGQEEVQIKMKEENAWEDENIIRFHLYSIWDGEEDPYTHVVGSHLPRPEELEYAQPDEADRAEQGELIFGDRCLLLLDPAKGSTDLEDYKEYFN